jgi:hypothetical protein
MMLCLVLTLVCVVTSSVVEIPPQPGECSFSKDSCGYTWTSSWKRDMLNTTVDNPYHGSYQLSRFMPHPPSTGKLHYILSYHTLYKIFYTTFHM